MKELFYKILRFFLQGKGYGFDPEATLASISDQDWEFGDGNIEARFGADKVIKADGQWTDSLPEGEIQRLTKFDTYHCTVFGTENAIQVMQIAKYGIKDEFSERFLGVLSNIKKNVGGSPLTVAEMWRKNGNLPYHFLPFTGIDTYEQFNSPKPMTGNLLMEARKFLDTWNFAHESVNDTSPKNLKEVLKYSPVGVGVYAWSFDASRGVYVKPNWAQPNHWALLIGYIDGKCWYTLDSYKDGGSFIKKLDWNYPFSFARRYFLDLKSPQEAEGVIEGKKEYDKLIGKHIMIAEGGNGEIYEVRKDYELFYEGWNTNSKWMQERLNEGLRLAEKRKEFIGITLDKFNKIMLACTLAGGGVVGKEEFTSKTK